MKLLHSLSAGVLAVATSFSTMLTAADSSPWRALPAETVLMARVADGSAAAEAIKATKFGQHLFDDERLASIEQLVRQMVGTEMAQADAKLEDLGLSRDDLFTIFTGDFGMGLVLLPPAPAADLADLANDSEPSVVVMGWATPGAELIGKVLAAVDTMVTEQANPDGGNAEKKVIQIAGKEVWHLTKRESVTTYRWDDEKGEPVEETTFGDPNHMYLCADGDRLFLATTEHSQFAALTDQFTNFLANQGGDGGFPAFIDSTPGMAAVTPAGVGVMEIAANLKPVWDMVGKLPDSDVGDMDAATFLTKSGIDSLAGARVVMTVDGGLVRSNAFMAVPKPHIGFMKLFGQPLLDAAPPAWVPAEIADYTTLAFDAEYTWNTVREVLTDLIPEAAMGMGQVDAMVPMFGVPNLAALLAGLGDRVSVVRFPTDVGDATDVDDIAQRLNNFALVWDVEDEPTWINVVQAAGQMMMAQQMPVQMATEEGWVGYSLDLAQMGQQAPPMGLYIGKEVLMFSMGHGVADKIIDSITNLPGSDLASSPLGQRSAELIGNEAGWSFSVSDMSGQVSSLMTAFTQMFEAGAGNDPEMEMAVKIMQLLPASADMASSMGVSTSRTDVTDDGMFMQAVMELPLAE